MKVTKKPFPLFFRQSMMYLGKKKTPNNWKADLLHILNRELVEAMGKKDIFSKGFATLSLAIGRSEKKDTFSKGFAMLSLAIRRSER